MFHCFAHQNLPPATFDLRGTPDLIGDILTHPPHKKTPSVAFTPINDYTGDKEFFALTVSAVPQRVCDAILKMDWNMPVETAVGEFIVEDDTTCAAGDNEMLFAFANTLEEGAYPDDDAEVTDSDYETTYTDYETTVSGESDCSGHGTWNGCGCDCDTGWYGSDCSLDVDLCNGHGTWNGCGCDCDTGWCGSDCSTGY